SILHSNIRAGKCVLCKGAKGLIIGGSIQAGELIAARTVGNTMSTPTSLEVGVAPALRSELQQLRSLLKQYADNADKTDKALHSLDQMAAAGTLTPDEMGLRSKLMSTKRKAAEETTATKDRIWEIEMSLDDIDKAKVEIS